MTQDATPEAAPAPDPVGTWRVPPDQRTRRTARTVEGPGTERFAFDGTTVTLMLFTEKEWMWKTADDHYRLKARWVGDELQYLPPFGTWTKLARFRDGHFESEGTSTPWIFERVTGAMKDGADRALDRPRAVHDYSIKPMRPR